MWLWTPLSASSVFLWHTFPILLTHFYMAPPAKLRKMVSSMWDHSECIRAQLTNTTMWSRFIIYLTFICALWCLHTLSAFTHSPSHTQYLHTLFAPLLAHTLASEVSGFQIYWQWYSHLLHHLFFKQYRYCLWSDIISKW